MRRFWDGWWVGVTVGVVALMLLVVGAATIYGKGIEQGRYLEQTNAQANGHGRYIEMTIDDRHYSGWLR